MRLSNGFLIAILFALPLGACDIFEEFPDEREDPDRYNLTVLVPGDAELAGLPLSIEVRVQGLTVLDTTGVQVPAAGGSETVLWEQAIAPSRNYDLYYWVDTGTADGVCDAPDDPQWYLPFTSPADQSYVLELSFAPTSATGECVVGGS